jgi:hypothetical protein
MDLQVLAIEYIYNLGSKHDEINSLCAMWAPSLVI